LTEADNILLEEHFSEDEASEAVFGSNADGALGPCLFFLPSLSGEDQISFFLGMIKDFEQGNLNLARFNYFNLLYTCT